MLLRWQGGAVPLKQRKRRNRKLTAKQKSIKEEKRQKTNFKNKIRNTFVAAGFEYLNTGGKHVTIGRRDVEIDLVVFFENIILICEDTATTVNRKDHIRKKAEAFQEISKNFGAYIEWLINTFPDKTVALQKYPLSRLKSFNLYFSQFPYDLTADEKSIYNSIIFIEPKSLEYFNHISKSIKKSARFEIFRFLSLHTQDIGLSTSTSENSRIDAPIIFPDDTTGFKNGIRLVSFMIDAETLLQLSYVLRKDNWEESIWLYQRLVEPKKLQSIRKFLATKETTFFNNIIVALPDDTRFLTEEKIYKKVEELENFEKCKLSIPREMNSICVIDGQHRIYAHYEGGSTDKYEARIAPLRK